MYVFVYFILISISQATVCLQPDFLFIIIFLVLWNLDERHLRLFKIWNQPDLSYYEEIGYEVKENRPGYVHPDSV